MRRHGEVLTLLDRSQVEVRPVAEGDGIVVLRNGNPVGAGRYRRRDDRSADLHLAIAQGWERIGVGATLLDLLAEDAEREGICRFVAEAAVENSVMLGVLTRWSPDCTMTIDHGVCRCDMPLGVEAAMQLAGR